MPVATELLHSDQQLGSIIFSPFWHQQHADVTAAPGAAQQLNLHAFTHPSNYKCACWHVDHTLAANSCKGQLKRSSVISHTVALRMSMCAGVPLIDTCTAELSAIAPCHCHCHCHTTVSLYLGAKGHTHVRQMWQSGWIVLAGSIARTGPVRQAATARVPQLPSTSIQGGWRWSVSWARHASWPGACCLATFATIRWVAAIKRCVTGSAAKTRAESDNVYVLKLST